MRGQANIADPNVPIRRGVSSSNIANAVAIEATVNIRPVDSIGVRHKHLWIECTDRAQTICIVSALFHSILQTQTHSASRNRKLYRVPSSLRFLLSCVVERRQEVWTVKTTINLVSSCCGSKKHKWLITSCLEQGRKEVSSQDAHRSHKTRRPTLKSFCFVFSNHSAFKVPLSFYLYEKSFINLINA